MASANGGTQTVNNMTATIDLKEGEQVTCTYGNHHAVNSPSIATQLSETTGAIGDTVNAAARIEAENKRFGTEVLISAATYAALSAEDRARLGCAAEPLEAHVKGKDVLLYLHPIPVNDPPSCGGKA